MLERRRWTSRASRGRLDKPLSWREVFGTLGLRRVGAGAEEGAVGWEGGDAEVWPLV